MIEGETCSDVMNDGASSFPGLAPCHCLMGGFFSFGVGGRSSTPGIIFHGSFNADRTTSVYNEGDKFCCTKVQVMGRGTDWARLCRGCGFVTVGYDECRNNETGSNDEW